MPRESWRDGSDLVLARTGVRSKRQIRTRSWQHHLGRATLIASGVASLIGRGNRIRFSRGNHAMKNTEYPDSTGGSHVHLSVDDHGRNKLVSCSEVVPPS